MRGLGVDGFNVKDTAPDGAGVLRVLDINLVTGFQGKGSVLLLAEEQGRCDHGVLSEGINV